jgi:hypothetical protein
MLKERQDSHVLGAGVGATACTWPGWCGWARDIARSGDFTDAGDGAWELWCLLGLFIEQRPEGDGLIEDGGNAWDMVGGEV